MATLQVITGGRWGPFTAGTSYVTFKLTLFTFWIVSSVQFCLPKHFFFLLCTSGKKKEKCNCQSRPHGLAQCLWLPQLTSSTGLTMWIVKEEENGHCVWVWASDSAAGGSIKASDSTWADSKLKVGRKRVCRRFFRRITVGCGRTWMSLLLKKVHCVHSLIHWQCALLSNCFNLHLLASLEEELKWPLTTVKYDRRWCWVRHAFDVHCQLRWYTASRHWSACSIFRQGSPLFACTLSVLNLLINTHTLWSTLIYCQSLLWDCVCRPRVRQFRQLTCKGKVKVALCVLVSW